MADSSKIMGRVKARRKDKALIAFTDHKGEQKTDKYAPLFVVWANQFGGGDVKTDKNVSTAQLMEYLTSGNYFVQFFPNAPKADDDF